MKTGKAGLAYLAANARYDEYLRRIDAMAVLENYGLRNEREEINTRTGETELIHSCILDQVDSHHRNGDANPSASCNLDQKKYICFSYWGGDLFHFIMKMEDKDDFNDILPIVREFLGDGTVSTETLSAELDKFFANIPGGAYNQERSGHSERVLVPWAFIHPYLETRGIDNDTASRFQIGWRESDNRLTIPHFWRGNLVGWQARRIPDCPGQWPGTWDDGPKYKSSPGFPKSDTFYSDPKSSMGRGREVIVVESPFSVLKAEALGVKGVVATFGSKVSNTQIKMLSEFSHVVLWADPDDAGRIMERSLVKRLYRHTGVSVVTPDWGTKLDMGDYTSAEDIETKIAEAIPGVLKFSEWNDER